MICVLLAAGHCSAFEQDVLSSGDNQYSHLEGVAKALLPGVGGRRILDYWWDAIKVRRLFNEVFLIVNGDKFKQFERWAMGADFPPSHIVNTGCSTPRQQLGAAVDLHQLLSCARVPDSSSDVLVVSGDMMFEDQSFDLTQVLEYFRMRRHQGDLALCYQLEQCELPQHVTDGDRCSRGLAEICPLTGRITRFLEKPLWSETQSRVCSVVFYCLRRATLSLLPQFLVERADAAPAELTCGSFMSWLINTRDVTVFGMTVPSGFQLIGSVSLGDYSSWLHILQRRRQQRSTRQLQPIRRRVYARVGLMGNPSDGFHGKTIALSIENFWAEVIIQESDSLRLMAHPLYDPTEFGSLADLYGTSRKEGYMGGLRLLQAACKRFYQFCSEKGLALCRRNFSLRYDTNIPRQVGLAGSSAIVCAVLHCLLQFHSLSAQVAPHSLAQLVLDVEKHELDIRAGLQDRVVQVYQGLVYMDFSGDLMTKRGYGHYCHLAVTHLPPLFLAYLSDPSDSGKIHSNVATRWENGDETVVDGMRQLAALTDKARDALLTHDWLALGQLMTDNFDIRRRLYGDACLGKVNLEMLELAERHGACCKFPGSGGAVLGLAKSTKHLAELRSVYQNAGFVFSEVVPLLTPAVDTHGSVETMAASLSAVTATDASSVANSV